MKGAGFYNRLCLVEVFLIKLFLILFLGLIFSAAMTRYLGHPINWSVDVAACLFAWSTFLGGDVALRKDKLMKVDVLVRNLPPKAKWIVEFVNLILILGFLCALVGYGIKISYTTRFRAFQGIPWFSYTWVTISVPIGSMLMLVTTILKLKEHIKSWGQ